MNNKTSILALAFTLCALFNFEYAAAMQNQMPGTSAGQSKEIGGIKFRWCPAGSFKMGSPNSEVGRFEDEGQHEVKLTQGYWLGETEVTQSQWKSVTARSQKTQVSAAINGTDQIQWHDGTASTFFERSNLQEGVDMSTLMADEDGESPIYYVSWNDAMEVCKTLTAMERKAGRLPKNWEFTLPTEAQWEYACRAGTSGSIYAKSMSAMGQNNCPELGGIAWYGGNSSQGYTGTGWDTASWPGKQYPGGLAAPRKVGQKQANAWGLKDMLGNVWEWCRDGYGEYPAGSATDPKGVPNGVRRVMRGGAWDSDLQHCRIGMRLDDSPALRFNNLGVRLAIVQTGPPEAKVAGPDFTIDDLKNSSLTASGSWDWELKNTSSIEYQTTTTKAGHILYTYNGGKHERPCTVTSNDAGQPVIEFDLANRDQCRFTFASQDKVLGEFWGKGVPKTDAPRTKAPMKMTTSKRGG